MVCRSARAIGTSPLCLGHMVEADRMLAVKQEAEEVLDGREESDAKPDLEVILSKLNFPQVAFGPIEE